MTKVRTPATGGSDSGTAEAAPSVRAEAGSAPRPPQPPLTTIKNAVAILIRRMQRRSITLDHPRHAGRRTGREIGDVSRQCEIAVEQHVPTHSKYSVRGPQTVAERFAGRDSDRGTPVADHDRRDG